MNFKLLNHVTDAMFIIMSFRSHTKQIAKEEIKWTKLKDAY